MNHSLNMNSRLFQESAVTVNSWIRKKFSIKIATDLCIGQIDADDKPPAGELKFHSSMTHGFLLVRRSNDVDTNHELVPSIHRVSTPVVRYYPNFFHFCSRTADLAIDLVFHPVSFDLVLLELTTQISSSSYCTRTDHIQLLSLRLILLAL